MAGKKQHTQPLDPGMLEERQRRVGILEGLVTQYENNGQTRKAVNNGLSRPTAATSAFRGKADANDAKADMPAAMSAVEGKADIVCQGLSGPFLARCRHSRWRPRVSEVGGRAVLEHRRGECSRCV